MQKQIAVNHLINQAVRLPVRQGVSDPVSQVVARSVGRSVTQPNNQVTNQPIHLSLPACLTVSLPHPGAYFMNTRVAFPLWHILLSSKEMPRMNCLRHFLDFAIRQLVILRTPCFL